MSIKINNISNSPLLQNFTGSMKLDNGDSFKSALVGFIADVNSDLKKAKKTQEKLVDNKVDNIVDAMVNIEKADISLRFATEIRNKAIEAYQEIMRMQV
jgi:flagellar hook-basal body complex protein FliE